MLSAVSEHPASVIAGIGACLYGLSRVLRWLVLGYAVHRAKRGDLPVIARALADGRYRVPGRRGDTEEGPSVPSD